MRTAIIPINALNEQSDTLLAEINNLIPQLSSSADPMRFTDFVNLCNHQAVRLIGMFEDTKLVGMLTLVLFPLPTGMRAWIEDVVVDESCRGKGYGRKLNEYAIELARREGAKTIDLTSRPSREAANGLYQSIGFQKRETNVYRYE